MRNKWGKSKAKVHRHGGRAPDIVRLLRREHESIRSVVERTAVGTPEDRQAAHGLLAEISVRHEVAEDLVVYPAVLRLRGGAAVTDMHLLDQDQMEDLFMAVDRAPFDSREFEVGSAHLGKEILSHLQQEEAQVLPMLSTMIGPRRRAELGGRFLAVTELAPLGQAVPGTRRTTGSTVVDRAAATAVLMRDSAVFCGLAS